jgi:CTP:molybdopterin cytidylyltransferase MocA
MKIGALVLAAGRASRFGSPKQLLEIDGITLLDRACRTALGAGCDPVLRVIGAHADQILSRACPQGVETLNHATWEEGMGSSLAAGAKRLVGLSPGLDAIVVLLADQPLVTIDLLDSMFRQLRRTDISIVLSDHGEATGPPSLFAAAHFDELMALSGDQGAKAIASKHLSAIARIPFPDGAWDIDSPEAWEQFIQARDASSERRSR